MKSFNEWIAPLSRKDEGAVIPLKKERFLPVRETKLNEEV
jgi:hypothetical protein